MKVNVYSKEITVSKDVEERITSQLAFLDKYILIDQNLTANANIKKQGNEVKVELTIPSKIGQLRAEVTDKDLNDAIDKAVKKLESKIRSQKGRLSRRHKEKLAKSFVEEDIKEETEAKKVVKTKRIVVDEIDVDDAILQLEVLDHDFFVYRDVTTKTVAIVYKRKDGNYGLMEIV